MEQACESQHTARRQSATAADAAETDAAIHCKRSTNSKLKVDSFASSNTRHGCCASGCWKSSCLLPALDERLTQKVSSRSRLQDTTEGLNGYTHANAERHGCTAQTLHKQVLIYQFSPPPPVAKHRLSYEPFNLAPPPPLPPP